MLLHYTVPLPIVATTLGGTITMAAASVAATEVRRNYDLPAGDAAITLNQFAELSGQQIIFMMDRVKGVRTNAISGEYAAGETLERMLVGTGLSARRDASGAFVVSRKRTQPEVKPNSDQPTQPKDNPVKKKSLLVRLSTAVAALSATVFSPSQVAEEADAAAKQSVLALPKFEVVISQDKGFFSKNTMAGTRSNERLANIPQNIQILNSELIQDLAQDNPIEALKYGSSGVNKRTSLLGDMFIRGFRVRGFLRDGVPFGSNFNVPLYDVDRIEMVKGPAAILYGQSSATGGLMNFVTKRPSAKRQNSVRATVGSFDFYRVEASSTGPLGVEDTNYRATLAATESDGARRFEYFRDRFFGFATDTKITPGVLMSFDYSFYHKDQIISQINATTNGDLTPVSKDFSFFEDWVDGPNYAQYASVSLKSQITPTLISSLTLNFNQMDTDWNRVNSNGVTNETTGIMNRTYQNVFQGDKNVTGIVDFVKTFRTGKIQHNLSFGGIITGNHSFNNVDSMFLTPLNTSSPVYGAPFPVFVRSVATPGQPAPTSTKTRARQDSGYLQEQISAFGSRLIVVGGVRYNQFHTTTTNKISQAVTTLDDNQLVKRWGIVVKPIAPVSLYYNYSESFIFNSGTFVGGPRNGEQLDPSLGKNKEVGLKVETSNGHLFGSIAVFDLSLTKVRVLFALPDGTGGIGQSGTETNKGYEADIGTYLETPIGPFQAILTYYKGDQKNSAGLRPNGVVNGTWSAYVSQGIDTGALKGLKIGFGVYRKGDVPFGSAAGQTRQFTAPSYTTSTAMIAYNHKNYRFAVNLDNVFDKDFIEGGENATWLYTSPGRAFKFSVDYRF